MYHYGTTGGAFDATIASVSGTIQETTMDWPGLGLSGSYGTLPFPDYSANNAVERISSDITTLINSQLGAGAVQLGIHTATGKGAVFCSKDGINNKPRSYL